MSRTIDRDARKAQLAEAVWQVILDEGIAAVSVRTVADRAGVVVGSLRHVFPTRTELVRFSAELMVERATLRLQKIPTLDDQSDYVFAIYRALLPLDANSRAELEINLALFAERTAVPELVEVREHAHEQLAALHRRLIELLTGEADTQFAIRQSRRMHALIDGLAFHLLHQPPESDKTWALELITEEITQLVPRVRS